MNLVDDATGRGMFLFSSEETTWAAAELLERWVRRFGVPQALYCDWKGVYQRQQTAREAIEGIEPQTQFGGMCEKLGIRMIGASSPQAKGRVERHHGTHQDRLVKKMRLAGLADYEAANVFLESYEREHNERFERTPAAKADYHLELPPRLELGRVFCLEEERVVSRDWVVRYQHRWLQLEVKRNQRVGAGTRVRVEQWRDGSLHVRHDGREIAFKEIAQPAPKAKPKAAPKRPPVRGKPKADHPWRRFAAVKKRAATA